MTHAIERIIVSAYLKRTALVRTNAKRGLVPDASARKLILENSLEIMFVAEFADKFMDQIFFIVVHPIVSPCTIEGA